MSVVRRMSRTWMPVPSASAGWTPLSLPGLRAWWGDGLMSSVTVAGGRASQWNDLSGNGRHFTQGTGANQPAYGTRTVNGKYVMDFDDTRVDYMTTASFTAVAPFSVFSVQASDDLDQNHVFWGCGIEAERVNMRRVLSLYFEYYGNDGGVDSGTANDTSIHKVVCRYKTSDHAIYVDNFDTYDAIDTFGGGSPTTATDRTSAWCVGTRLDDLNPALAVDGYICTVGICDPISDTNRALLATYLNTTWGA